VIHNVSESSVAYILSPTDENQKKFLVLEGNFLFIDVTRCFNCRFKALIKPVATKYECNSTLRIAQGSLELVKQLSEGSCLLHLEAPPFYRVLFKVVDLYPFRALSTASENCSLRKIIFGPLSGVPTQNSWTPCNATE
ncbi:hypothetical protein X975_04157, partial [Stegodyphus mimosarum]